MLGGLYGALIAGITVGLVYAPDPTLELMGLVPISAMVVGKFLPLWGITGESQFGPWELGLVIWALDTFTVVTVVYALEGAYRIERIKRGLEHIQANARLVLRAYPRIRRGALAGVVAFVLFPVAGTGALVGSFVGIFLGLHRRTLIAAVSAGGLLGGMGMAYLATHFAAALTSFQAFQKNPTVKWATMAAVALVIAGFVLWLGRLYRRALDRAQAEPAE